jgi:DNA-binding NtrC family response regulator
MAAERILVVDDRISTLKVLMALLADEGYEVLQATSGAQALEVLEAQPVDAVLADLKMPDLSGLELFHRAEATAGPTPPFIIMTAYGTVKNAVQALKEGVTDYLIKPVNFDELGIILHKALREWEMRRELSELKARVGGHSSFHGLISASPAMQEIFELVRTVGPTDASVLIRGETGTGKELLARALHAESHRTRAPLVAINCAALTESLLEAELFGHVRGAFTGAHADKPGRLQAAHRGTLFLDEIGHMSLALQSKLLRFLQERTYEPVGGARPVQVDVRVLAATNQDLQALIRAGSFLPDLLYRIEVISLRVPALRERPEDVPLLAGHLVSRYARQYDREVMGIAPEAAERLAAYPWPGNVREMENVLARAVILTKDQRVTVESLPAKLREPADAGPPAELIPQLPAAGATLKDLERELIAKTLEQCDGNKSRAARRLGISRKAIYEKMQRYGIADPKEGQG